MFTQKKFSEYTIELTKLLYCKNALIENNILDILDEYNINLKINVFDSNPNQDVLPIMVFIHGNSTSKKIFADQIRRYANSYRVIAIDLLGHGDSTKINNIENIPLDVKKILCETFYNPIAMIAEVTCLLASMSISNAHFIGWSLGGHIAYGVAVANPGLVASIISIGAPPIKFSSDGFNKGFNEWFINTVSEWINQPQYYTFEMAKEIGLKIGIDNVDVESFASDMLNSDPQMRRNLFSKLKLYNLDEYSRSILDGENFAYDTNIPLCIIVGEKDTGINTEYIRNFSNKMCNPLSGTYIIEGALHAVFKTHKDIHNTICDSFINQCLSRHSKNIQFSL